MKWPENSTGFLALAAVTLSAWIWASDGRSQPAGDSAGPAGERSSSQDSGLPDSQESSAVHPVKFNMTSRLDDRWTVSLNLSITGLMTTIDSFHKTPAGETVVMLAFDVQVKEACPQGSLLKWNLFGLLPYAPQSTESLPIYTPDPVRVSITPTNGRTWGTLRGKEDVSIDIHLNAPDEGK